MAPHRRSGEKVGRGGSDGLISFERWRWRWVGRAGVTNNIHMGGMRLVPKKERKRERERPIVKIGRHAQAAIRAGN